MDLSSWMSARLGEPVEVTFRASPSAGQSNDTQPFTAGGREYVLRRQPGPRRLFLDPDVRREARVIDALACSEVPVPQVVGAGEDFFVMERVPGRVPFGKPSIHRVGWLPDLGATERYRLWSSALDTVTAVHRVDWRRTHAFIAERGVGLDTHIGGLERWYEWVTGGRPFPIVDAAHAAIVGAAGAIEAADPVLVWGDARLGNMIFADDLTVAAAIDWELASIGPGGIDLGHWLFFDEFSTTACGVERLAGFPDRAATLERYEALGGSIADVEFFELLQAWFMATTVIRQADLGVAAGRFPEGTRMGHDNVITQMIARRLGLPVPDLSPDYVTHRS
jgi:aminoglycoside phosphotransferase (APT) family kinase protein